MAYCTQADILKQISEEELIDLTDDTHAGSVNADVVTEAIEKADAMIDAYCQGRYTIPLSPVPTIIRALSVDLALYYLFARRADAMPEERRDGYKNAESFLKALSAGKVQIGAATPVRDDTPGSVEMDGNTRLFTRTKMEGF